MGAYDEPAWDLYREIHKAARWVLCRAIMVTGSADAGSDEAMGEVRDAVDEVVFVLRGHHGHEHDFVDELIVRHASELQGEVEAAHASSDEGLDRIVSLTDLVVAEPAAGRNPLLHRLHLDLSTFAAEYFVHLDLEERRVMPLLNAAMTNAELMQVTEALRSSIEPSEMGRFMQTMLPSMNLLERSDMLAGMSHAPPEIWDLFRSAARRALSTDEYSAATSQL